MHKICTNIFGLNFSRDYFYALILRHWLSITYTQAINEITE